MVARRGTSPPGRNQQSCTARTQLAEPALSGLGEKGGAQFHFGITQIASGSTSGNAGGVCGKLAGSLSAGQAGSGRTPFDQSRTRRKRGRQRGCGESAPDT